MTITDREWVARHLTLQHSEMPSSAKRVIGQLVSDTIAIASYARSRQVGGTRFDLAGISTNATGCAVWGSPARAAGPDAAFLNGNAAEALDYQEVLINGRNNGHAAVIIVPAVMALAEMRRASSNAVLQALWVAFAANIGLAETLGRGHRANGLGFRTTSLTAPVAAALGCATLIGADEDAALAALGIAASSLPAGLLSAMSPKMGSYSPDKDLSVGFSARHAIHCALLAQAGAYGPEQPLTGDRGWLASFGAGTADPAYLDIHPIDRGLEAYSIKLYPANFGCQSAIRAAIELSRTLRPEEVSRLHVQIKTSSAASLSTRAISNHLAARFSLPFAVASAFVRGRSVLEDFEDEAIHDERVLAFMDKVELDGSDELEQIHLSRGVFPAIVTAYSNERKLARLSFDGPFDGLNGSEVEAAFFSKLKSLAPSPQYDALKNFSLAPEMQPHLDALFAL
ncbi:MmgE/PrpD family protein [Chelativorans sp. SCAU2101]|uniref:MmgE/PrpD family protein n=1 Tax=Chelativorans petroleitrophicus TaxID=2975484 RepID=A0A9X2X9B4_9HYPH|nr:MmgE/PrpD family protein [Chelativorans petroleitrophicus]MCT8990506.1 MmgE/PrpD family protein [Chelativorans petroleitrophicus]